MKTQLLSLVAVAALLAMSAPTSAQADAAIAPPRCPSEVSVNEAQDCLTWAAEVANRQIDNAQDDVEDVLVLICDIACNFVTLEQGRSSGVTPVIATACPVTPVSVNNVQKCITYVVYYVNGRIDYAQDRVEDVLELVCDIACNFIVVQTAADGSIGTVALPCKVGTVNDVQKCVTYVVYVVNFYVDYTQDRAEDVIDLVCDIACNFAVASVSSAAPVDAQAPCKVGTVNDIQDCITWTVYYANLWVDFVQYEIEFVLETVCDIACNFVALESADARAADPLAAVALPCKAGSVNDVQKCLTWAVAYLNSWVDYAQYWVEFVLDTVCTIACNLATLETATGASTVPALAADPLAIRVL